MNNFQQLILNQHLFMLKEENNELKIWYLSIHTVIFFVLYENIFCGSVVPTHQDKTVSIAANCYTGKDEYLVPSFLKLLHEAKNTQNEFNAARGSAIQAFIDLQRLVMAKNSDLLKKYTLHKFGKTIMDTISQQSNTGYCVVR